MQGQAVFGFLIVRDKWGHTLWVFVIGLLGNGT